MEMVEATVLGAPAYRARVLSLDEWQRREHELPYLPGTIPPTEFARLVVVEDRTGRIIASWCAMNLVMLEGLHMQPGHPMAAKHLLLGMIHELLEMGTPAAATRIESAAVVELAEHAGFVRIPGELYQIDLRGR